MAADYGTSERYLIQVALNYTASEVPTEFIPDRTKAAREKFAGMLEFLEAEKV